MSATLSRTQYGCVINDSSWWRHQMETFSALLALCAGNSPVLVNSPRKGQWRGALVFSLICAGINESWSLWRQCDVISRFSAAFSYYGVVLFTTSMISVGTTCEPSKYTKGISKSLKSRGGLPASPWWRHQMETFSALLAICTGNSSVTGEFPIQRPVTQSFDGFFFDRPLNKWLGKQSWGWWFEKLSRPLWRHCNDCYPSGTVSKTHSMCYIWAHLNFHSWKMIAYF